MLNRIVDEGHLEEQCVYIFQRLIDTGHEVRFSTCSEETWQHIDTVDDLEKIKRNGDILLKV